MLRGENLVLFSGRWKMFHCLCVKAEFSPLDPDHDFPSHFTLRFSSLSTLNVRNICSYYVLCSLNNETNTFQSSRSFSRVITSCWFCRSFITYLVDRCENCVVSRWAQSRIYQSAFGRTKRSGCCSSRLASWFVSFTLESCRKRSCAVVLAVNLLRESVLMEKNTSLKLHLLESSLFGTRFSQEVSNMR